MVDFSFFSEDEMVDIIISKNKELKISYEIYQEILIAIQDRNFKRFKFIFEKY